MGTLTTASMTYNSAGRLNAGMGWFEENIRYFPSSALDVYEKDVFDTVTSTPVAFALLWRGDPSSSANCVIGLAVLRTNRRTNKNAGALFMALALLHRFKVYEESGSFLFRNGFTP